MKYTFITAISLQKKDLQKVCYMPVDFTLENNLDTSFPIIPIISEKTKDASPDDIQIIAIIPQNESAEKNYLVFLQELADLGISKAQVEEIRPGMSLGKQGSVKVLMELLDKIPDESYVYTDITYSSKAMSAMQLYATHLIEKIKDSEVDGIYYGEFLPGTSSEAKLHDITLFKSILDISNQLEIMGITDIREALRKLTGE